MLVKQQHSSSCCAVLELLLTGISLRTYGRNEVLRLHLSLKRKFKKHKKYVSFAQNENGKQSVMGSNVQTSSKQLKSSWFRMGFTGALRRAFSLILPTLPPNAWEQSPASCPFSGLQIRKHPTLLPRETLLYVKVSSELRMYGTGIITKFIFKKRTTDYYMIFTTYQNEKDLF